MKQIKSKALRPKVWEHLLFLGPATVIFCVVVLAPFLLSIAYSFTDWNGVSNVITFVGLKNFISIFTGKSDFLESFQFTFTVALINLILVNVLGILLAAVLSGKMKFRNGFKLLFYMPNIIGGLILGFIWQFIFTNGLPAIGKALGIPLLSSSWLAAPETAMWAIIVVSVWQGLGYVMMVMVSAFASVPAEMVESAQIDGAGPVQIFFRIKLPLVISYVTVCVFWTLASSFKMFELNYSLTKGGPYGTTTSMALNIYNDAFANNKYGLATAESLIFFLIVMFVAGLQMYFSRREEKKLS